MERRYQVGTAGSRIGSRGSLDSYFVLYVQSARTIALASWHRIKMTVTHHTEVGERETRAIMSERYQKEATLPPEHLLVY